MTVDLSREELLVENGRLLAALQRLGEAYQIREENFAEYVARTKEARARADRYLLAYRSARRRAAFWRRSAQNWRRNYEDCQFLLVELQRRYDEVCTEHRECVP